MTILDKKKNRKFLRAEVHREDYDKFLEQARAEHLPLATWVRQKLLQYVNKDRLIKP